MNFPKGYKDKSKLKHPRARPKEAALDIETQATLQMLVGERDHNLKFVEKELDIKIGRTPQGLLLCGQDSDVDLAYDLLLQLKNLIERGESIFNGDVERALKMLAADRKIRLEDLFRDHVNISGRKHAIVPKTPNQKEYVDAIRSHDIVFGIGPAGTGKTYLAMAMAVASLLAKDVKRVVLCRPAVEAGEKLGYLPGDMVEKVNPYLRPLYDALHDMLDVERASELIEKGLIEVAPLAFMRGRTLSNSFVILDEGQNTTPVQMKMFLTRVGLGSKCVVTGDITQIDLPKGTVSGLTDALQILKSVQGLSFVHFTDEDVVRHHLVSRIILAYQKRKESQVY